MTFKKPCIHCGQLATTTPCPPCHTAHERNRNRIRDANPERIAKKRALYNAAYKRQRDLLKKRGGICYLCGEVVPPSTGQADHIYPGVPDSPLAITHAFCNQSRGNKKL
jgi:hypothetical protein